MSVTLAVVRTPANTLAPATAADAETLAGLKTGKPYKLEVKQMSNRSYQHHKLFFGGLLPLAYQYWQPTGGMVTQGERQAVTDFAAVLDGLAGTDGDFAKLAEEYLTRKAQRRGEKIGAVLQDMEAFRKWLTIEAGYFDLFETPAGIRKEAKSISFASMDQEEFNAFYRNCFQVAWNLMLRFRFESEEAAQAAVMEMMEFGA